MEIQEFLEKFSDLFDDTDVSTLSPECDFRNLDEWSSLSTLGVIALADEDFGVEISGNEIGQLNTIQELYDFLKAKSSN